MINNRKIARLESRIEDLRTDNSALLDERRALEIELKEAEKRLARSERENKLLRESMERLMQQRNTYYEAMDDAKKEYQDAADGIRALQKKLEREACAQIAQMRGENRLIMDGRV